MRGSIVIPCFNSHEIVRRQILWLDSWMKPFSDRWDLVIVDDGSEPEITITRPTNFSATVIHIPPHRTRWTQHRARNVGAKSCPESEFIFFMDVDHILTMEALAASDSFAGDMLKFPRKTGALDENGRLLADKEDLLRFGASLAELRPHNKVATTTCLVRRTVQDAIGGFNESLSGKYGHDDAHYRQRYNRHSNARKCRSPELSRASIYVFPNPRDNHQGLFHSLNRKRIP